MRLFLILITIFFSSYIHAKDLFGFVISMGHGQTYNSFNETYSRVLCEKGDSTIYNSKIRLSTNNMAKIQSSLESIKFWYMETDELVTYSADEVVRAIAPCDQKTLFAQKNNDINYVWASCGSLPKKK